MKNSILWTRLRAYGPERHGVCVTLSLWKEDNAVDAIDVQPLVPDCLIVVLVRYIDIGQRGIRGEGHVKQIVLGPRGIYIAP